MKKVKVRFNDGRVAFLAPKLAQSQEVVAMGGVIIQEPKAEVKTFVPIPVSDQPKAERQVEKKEPTARKKRGPNKKKADHAS